MNTGELERLERLLENALHEADQVPVDLPAGRAALAPWLDQRQQSMRRRTVISVAASVLAVILASSLVFAGLRDDKESLPVAPPTQHLQSGLPIGMLKGQVQYPPGVTPGPFVTPGDRIVRFLVRADATGSYGIQGAGGAEALVFPVRYVGAALGHVTLKRDSLVCTQDDTDLTLDFTVRGDTVTITRADTGPCSAFPDESVVDLRGVVLRLTPETGATP